MGDIKRYTFDTCQCGCEKIEIHESKDGPYVTYEDHVAEVLRLKTLLNKYYDITSHE
jgi:hypothetical protein